MKRLKIFRLILANIIILSTMVILLLVTPNDWRINQLIISMYLVLILIFNLWIVE